MDIRLDRGLQNAIHNSAETRRLLAAAAYRIAPRIAAATPVDTGGTRASTHVETGHRSADGRSAAARVVQSGAAVQQQFGNSRENSPARQFNRAGL